MSQKLSQFNQIFQFCYPSHEGLRIQFKLFHLFFLNMRIFFQRSHDYLKKFSIKTFLKAFFTLLFFLFFSLSV